MPYISPDNPILDVDSYKSSHPEQYAPGVTAVSCYAEARKSGFDPAPGTPPADGVLWFGMQGVLKRSLRPVTMDDVEEAESVLVPHGEPFFRRGWEKVVREYGGDLPVTVQSLPEGMFVPMGVPLYQVTSVDDPDLFFLAPYIETMLLRVWYTTTVATRSFRIKRMLAESLERTGDPAGLPFKLHDFGARGASSRESAGLGGMAHLVNFLGTDTVQGLVQAANLYDAGPACGFSIPASEHSVMLSWGSDREIDAFRNMISLYRGKGRIFACVSDTYDFWDAVGSKWPSLDAELKESGATLVVRPDSGVPEEVVPETLRRLASGFGCTRNGKGYAVLPDRIRVIQGDGISEASIARIIRAVEGAGFSLDNVAFGMGGELLQNVTRDVWSFAQKVSAAKDSGTWRDTAKCPVDAPEKRSKGGRFAVVTGNDGLPVCVRRGDSPVPGDLLETVFENGRFTGETGFSEIRKRAEASLSLVSGKLLAKAA